MINKLHINEEYPTSPNSIVNDKIAEFVKYLETNGIKVADVSYSNKAIYINKLIDAKKALNCLKTDFYPTRQLGVMIYCPYIKGNIEKILPVEACMVENKQKGKNNMIRRIKEDYNPNGFAVTGYLSPHRGAVEDRYFDPNEWSEIEYYAHELLMKGLYVNIIYFRTGEQLDIDPTEYQNYFDGDFEINDEIAEFKNSVINENLIKEALTGSVPVIRNPKYSINVDTKTELILDLLLGMRCIYSKGSDATYIGYLKNNEFIVAFVDPNKDNATFLKFENLTDDDTDDIITVLSEGASRYDTFLEDYNPTEHSFWEFMMKQLY